MNAFANRIAASFDAMVLPRREARRLREEAMMSVAMIDRLAARCVEEAKAQGVDAGDWETGIADEIRFWWGRIAEPRNERQAKKFARTFRLNRPFDYGDDLRQDREPRQIEALDIGCALRPALGRRWRRGRINIVAADPLASAYQTLLDAFGIERGFSLEWCVAEKTADVFGTNRFDFVLAKNALDHGYDPALAFEQIAAALKPGGVGRFRHWKNEAEYHGYAGFHQWNIEPDGEGLRVWRPGADRKVDFRAFGCAAEITPVKAPKRSGEDHPAFEVRIVKSLG